MKNSLAQIYSRAQVGTLAELVRVEVNLARGLPSLSIVGMAETAVKESKDRVRAAIINSRFEFPVARITVNLAPADLPKEGGRFDLAIAIGILCASEQIAQTHIDDYEFIGELALSGDLRAVPAVLPAAVYAQQQGRALVVPEACADQAAQVKQAKILAAQNLLQVCAHLRGERTLPRKTIKRKRQALSAPDMADVRGQYQARRALEIAAAGEHSLLFIGPPGTGKTLLASRLPGILPMLSETQALETAIIHSLGRGRQHERTWYTPPFRNPHHTASGVALVGGGGQPKPGEVSLAHNGVLFLDELAEFSRQVLDVLREPLEAGHITISRAARQCEFPARFQLIAAMNPCPCGYFTHPNGRCHCSADAIVRYQNKVSGPLLDRIDMHVEVPPLPRHVLMDREHHAEPSHSIRKRVIACRSKQLKRSAVLNAHLNNKQLEQLCRLDKSLDSLLEQALDNLGLSARAYHRILRLARTIADLEGCDSINKTHLLEAISYRRLDRAHDLNRTGSK